MAVIGGKFRDYVDGQVKQRQKMLGGDVMVDQTLKALNTNTPWIRMASSVNITEGDKSLPGTSVYEQIIQKNIFEGFKWKEDNLAKNFVLFNGVNNNVGGIDNMPTGNTSKTGNPLQKAYGFGYNNLGAKNSRGPIPLPGIQSVNFTYKNDGALAQASVKVKCFSPEQFQMIDILFQRPGYTVLLEFGHSVFKDNKGKLQYAGQGDYNYNTAPFQHLYKPDEKKGFYNLLDKIESEKKNWDGNYEAFYAKISKFNWSFNQDGSYDITVNLIGLGDVISSLRLDVAPPNITFSNPNPDSDISTSLNIVKSTFKKDQSSYIKITSQEYLKSDKSTTTTGFSNIKAEFSNPDLILNSYSDGGFVYYNDKTNNKYYKISNSEFKKSTYTLSKSPTIQNSLASAFTYELRRIKELMGVAIKDNNDDDTLIPYTSTPYPQMLGDGVVNQNVLISNGVLGVRNKNTEGFDPGTYIGFGVLLSILQQFSNQYSKGIPVIQFDFNFIDMRNDDNYIKVYSGLFSSNPSKILIPYGQLPSNVVGEDNKPLIQPKENQSNGKSFNRILSEGGDNFLTGDLNKGKLAYVYLSLDYLSEKYVSSINPEGNEILTLDFLKDVLKDINDNLNNLNNFKILHNKENNKIQIVSETPIGETNKELTRINTFGVTKTEGSFVKSINLDSELSDNYATQISVGAQNNGSNSQSNSLSFSTYNKGLIDRMIPEKNDDGSIKNDSPPTGSASTIKKPETWNDIWTDTTSEIFLNVYRDYNIESETLNSLKDLNNNISRFISGELTKKSLAPPPMFLPFNLKLTLQGLSGVQIYNSFTIDGKVLPLSYDPKQIELTIKSLSHTVDNNGWVTQIDTFSRPLFIYNSENIKVEEVPYVSLQELIYGEDPPFFMKTYKGKTEPGGGVLRISPNSGNYGQSQKYKKPPTLAPFQGPTPNADILRKTLSSLGYREKQGGTTYPGGPQGKGGQLSNRGDITLEAANGFSTFFKKLKELYPEIRVKVSGGNDLYHQSHRSAHRSGKAIDFTVSGKNAIKNTKQLLQQFSVGSGGTLRYFDEYINKTKNTDGKHYHTSIGFIESKGTYSNSQTLVKKKKLPVYNIK
jgi:hypothetical protein